MNKTYDSKRISWILQTAREMQGLSQAEVAIKLSVSQPTYNRLERGLATLNIFQAAIVSDALNIPPSTLIDAARASLTSP